MSAGYLITPRVSRIGHAPPQRSAESHAAQHPNSVSVIGLSLNLPFPGVRVGEGLVRTPVAPLGMNPRELSHLGLPIAFGLVESRGVASLHHRPAAAAYSEGLY